MEVEDGHAVHVEVEDGHGSTMMFRPMMRWGLNSHGKLFVQLSTMARSKWRWRMPVRSMGRMAMGSTMMFRPMMRWGLSFHGKLYVQLSTMRSAGSMWR